MRILNLYAGIGGNRHLWSSEHKVVAVEQDLAIARIYCERYPDDDVVVGDAHTYLLSHYKEFDFIWSSPPCATHSKARQGLGVRAGRYGYVYPDMSLYQEIIFLRKMFEGLWCVENVVPYYKCLTPPTIVINRHAYWTNFTVSAPATVVPRINVCRGKDERSRLEEVLGIDLCKYYGIDKRKILRNCVEPEIGNHILQCALRRKEMYDEARNTAGKR